MEVKSPIFQTNHGNSFFIPADVIEQESANPFLSNLIVTKIGYYNKAKGHSVYRPTVNEYVFLYCVDGKGTVELSGQTKQVKNGDIVFLYNNRQHAYFSDSHEPWSIHWAHFNGKAVPELFNLLGVTEQDFVLTIGVITRAVDILTSAYNALSTGYTTPNLLYSSTLLQEFFSFIIRIQMNLMLKSDEKLGTTSSIQNIIDFMTQHVYENLTLDDFSSYMGLSKFHFSRTFKEKTGYPPVEYFNRLKIQRACELLDTSSLNIEQISDRLSFNNSYYFSKVFKRITSCSPSNYRGKMLSKE